jgi:hypothetical protein
MCDAVLVSQTEPSSALERTLQSTTAVIHSFPYAAILKTESALRQLPETPAAPQEQRGRHQPWQGDIAAPTR